MDERAVTCQSVLLHRQTNEQKKRKVRATEKNMRNTPYGKAILVILRSHCPNAIDLQTIYIEMPQYRRLSEHDKEPWVDKFGRKFQQNFKHTIRSVLADLVKKGKAEKDVKRGYYRSRDC
jgi:hypothetical protein